MGRKMISESEKLSSRSESEPMNSLAHFYDPMIGFLPCSDFSTGISNNGNGLEVHFRNMNPFLRALLVTDGTVTKLLEAYLWEPVCVERLFHQEIRLKTDLPMLELKAGDSVLQRHVRLRGVESRRVYTYAESYVKIDLLETELQDDLRAGKLGMGELLRDRRLETYREILSFWEEQTGELGSNMELSSDELLYCRCYRIFVSGRPVIQIVEKLPVTHY